MVTCCTVVREIIF